MQDKEYRIEIRVKNNNILRKIEEAGYKTIGEFCRVHDKKNWQSTIGDFVNLKKSPINSRGEFHPCINWICDVLYCSPDELFSEVQMNTALEENKKNLEVGEAEMQFTLQNMKEPLSLEDHTALSRLPEKVNELMDTLTPRESKIIKLRFGLNGLDPHILEELSQIFDVNRERIRQIEAKALRKLRHPSRSNNLRDYIEENDD